MTDAPHPRHMGRLRIIKEGIKHVEPINNTESVARDHLSNERTLLAWIRTAISIAALCIIIVRFRVDDNDPRLDLFHLIFGCILLAIAFICMMIGFYRYCEIRVFLLKDLYPSSGIGFLLTVALTTIILAMILIMLLVF